MGASAEDSFCLVDADYEKVNVYKKTTLICNNL
jgi:hypothetical protein